jgi:hypothetical protein
MITGWSVPTWSQAELAMPSKVIVRLEVRFPLLFSYFAFPAAGNTTPDYLVNRPALAFLFHLFQLNATCDSEVSESNSMHHGAAA